jgi:hypothetical protein
MKKINKIAFMLLAACTTLHTEASAIDLQTFQNLQAQAYANSDENAFYDAYDQMLISTTIQDAEKADAIYNLLTSTVSDAVKIRVLNAILIDSAIALNPNIFTAQSLNFISQSNFFNLLSQDMKARFISTIVPHTPQVNAPTLFLLIQTVLTQPEIRNALSAQEKTDVLNLIRAPNLNQYPEFNQVAAQIKSFFISSDSINLLDQNLYNFLKTQTQNLSEYENLLFFVKAADHPEFATFETRQFLQSTLQDIQMLPNVTDLHKVMSFRAFNQHTDVAHIYPIADCGRHLEHFFQDPTVDAASKINITLSTLRRNDLLPVDSNTLSNHLSDLLLNAPVHEKGRIYCDILADAKISDQQKTAYFRALFPLNEVQVLTLPTSATMIDAILSQSAQFKTVILNYLSSLPGTFHSLASSFFVNSDRRRSLINTMKTQIQANAQEISHNLIADMMLQRAEFAIETDRLLPDFCQHLLNSGQIDEDRKSALFTRFYRNTGFPNLSLNLRVDCSFFQAHNYNTIMQRYLQLPDDECTQILYRMLSHTLLHRDRAEDLIPIIMQKIANNRQLQLQHETEVHGLMNQNNLSVERRANLCEASYAQTNNPIYLTEVAQLQGQPQFKNWLTNYLNKPNLSFLSAAQAIDLYVGAPVAIQNIVSFAYAVSDKVSLLENLCNQNQRNQAAIDHLLSGISVQEVLWYEMKKVYRFLRTEIIAGNTLQIRVPQTTTNLKFDHVPFMNSIFSQFQGNVNFAPRNFYINEANIAQCSDAVLKVIENTKVRNNSFKFFEHNVAQFSSATNKNSQIGKNLMKLRAWIFKHHNVDRQQTEMTNFRDRQTEIINILNNMIDQLSPVHQNHFTHRVNGNAHDMRNLLS